MTVAELLASAIRQLNGHCDSPVLEAEWLLAHVLGKPASWLLAYPEQAVEESSQHVFAKLLRRRLQGEPHAYVTGRRGFWMFELDVTCDVLIPRPETELLVELALERIPNDQPLLLADLGTGSGAVAIALALERPLAQVIATDISDAALAVAQANAHRLGTDNLDFAQGIWGDALPADTQYHLIVSNPPYVAEDDPHLAQLSHEPQLALTAGEDGLNALRYLIPDCFAKLTADGWLLVEHGAQQGQAVQALFQQAGYSQRQTWQDLAGLDRVTGGCKA